MAVPDRDSIRSGDWSKFENDVAGDLVHKAVESLSAAEDLVIDTHFAAKVNGSHYRIGLRHDLIFQIVQRACEFAANRITLRVLVVHIHSDPFALLARRRLDKERKRELVPSDCVTALSRNSVCAGQYHHEALRAVRAAKLDPRSVCAFHRVDNDDLLTALARMKEIFSKEDTHAKL
jgi:adenylate kinase